jgi:hypothetical protein
MNYWLDLFTGETWQEFQQAGCKVSGFRARQHKYTQKIKTGDVFVCYLTGVMRWVGALEVIGPSVDQSKIWASDDFPVRFDVKPLIILPPEHGIPMDDLEGELSFFEGEEHRGGYKGFLRGSPNLFKIKKDAELILQLLKEAKENPTLKPVDPKKLYKKLYTIETKKGAVKVLVSVPESDESSQAKQPSTDLGGTKHSEIQHLLLQLGAKLCLNVWVARNDRGRKYKNQLLGAMPRMLDELPTQFNDATTRTIELIDVLWMNENSVVGAFEVEHSTSVYSGLLRMNDLMALQPNLDIDFYLVAAEERRDKVKQEILRPTFNLREKPLCRVCGFLSYESLTKQIDGIQKLGLTSSLKPNFLKSIAEYFESAAKAAKP